MTPKASYSLPAHRLLLAEFPHAPLNAQSEMLSSILCHLTSDLRPLTSCCLLVPSEVAGLPAANWQLFAVVCHLSSVVFFPYAPRSMPSDPQYTRTVKNGKDLFDRLSQINQLA